MTSDLTPRQRSVLEYIIAFQQEHRMAPTVREICAHLGLSGPAGIHRILSVLKDKGYILAEPGKKRSWRFSKAVTGTGIPLIGTIAAGNPRRRATISCGSISSYRDFSMGTGPAFRIVGGCCSRPPRAWSYAFAVRRRHFDVRCWMFDVRRSPSPFRSLGGRACHGPSYSPRGRSHPPMHSVARTCDSRLVSR